METVFLELLNRALCAGWLVLAIILLRAVFRKAPKWICCLLWGLVAIRLLCPFSVESFFSLIPSAQTVPPAMMTEEKPEIHTGIETVNSMVNPMISDTFSPGPDEGVHPVRTAAEAASRVWLAGAAVMLAYAAGSDFFLRRRVRTAVPVCGESAQRAKESAPGADGSAGMRGERTEGERERAGLRGCRRERHAAHRNVRRQELWESERVDSPFVLGILRPRIYLPTGIDACSRAFIIAHERAHIRRKDHWIKPFGFALLSVYWFHPLMWAAYILLCRDIEYACDERVIREYGVEERKAYSAALLACSVRRPRIAACPVAFGEVGVRQRIRSVLHYKKPAFWILLTAAACCAVVAVCFLTDPKTKEKERADNGTASEEERIQAESGAESAGEASGVGDGNETASAGEAGSAGDGNETASAGEAGSAGDGNEMASAGEANGAKPAGDGGTEYAGEDSGAPQTIEIPADGWYDYDRCIYMNALSSYFPFDLREVYYMDESGVRLYDGNSLDLAETSFLEDKKSEGWRMIGVEEFEQAFNGWELGMPDISEIPAEKRLVRELTERVFLYYMDGELWLARTAGVSSDAGMWSIYALRPKEDMLEVAVRKAAYEWAVEKEAFGYWDAQEERVYPCVSCMIFGTELSSDAAREQPGGDGRITVYASILAMALQYENETEGLKDIGGSRIDAAMTFEKEENGEYRLTDWWTPREGAYYVPDIRERFPDELAEAVIDGQSYAEEQIRECYAQAVSLGQIPVYALIESLFERIAEDEDGLAPEGADARALIEAYPLVYRQLCRYGDNTLRYVFQQFFNGGKHGVYGQLMKAALIDIYPDEIIRLATSDGQEYFDCWFAAAQEIAAEIRQGRSAEEADRLLQEKFPKAALAVRMWEARTTDAEADAE